MISVDTYVFYTIVQNKPHPFQRLRWPVTVERDGAYANRVLCILTLLDGIKLRIPVINDHLSTFAIDLVRFPVRLSPIKWIKYRFYVTVP